MALVPNRLLAEVPRARKRGDIEFLVGALQDDDREVRNAAARSLGLLRDRRAVEPLTRRLDERDDVHRILVINALGKIGDPLPAARIYEIATDPRAFGLVRIRAMVALGHLGDGRALPLIGEALVNPSRVYGGQLRRSWIRSTRKGAARELVRLGDQAAVPYLVRALDGAPLLDRRHIRRAMKALEQPSALS